MVDVHSHILPGIDDGSKSLEESLALCRAAAEDGISTMAATPHVMEFRYPNTRRTIEEPFARLAEAVAAEKIPIEIVKGAEVHVAADIIPRLKDGDLLTYNDNRRYLLLEFPFQQVVNGTEEMVYRLRLAGITPVIAHPERIEFFMAEPARLEKLVRLGAIAQVTGGSLLGGFGEKAHRAAWKMVQRRLVHLVASDAHDLKSRRPALRDAVRALAGKIGEEEAARMSREVPAALIAGHDVDVPEPVATPKGVKGFLRRFFPGR